MTKLLILLTTIFVFSGQGNYSLVSSIKVDGNRFNTDNLGNTYVIKGNTLTKYTAKGDKLNQYSSKLYGEITTIDAQNPLQILVYYRDITKVLFLDNTLSVHETISLEQHNLEQTSLVCTSANNGFWVYDMFSIQLIRVDRNVNRIQETGNITQILSKEINPDFLVESNNRVYLNDPAIGILVFDIYGTYLKTIPIKNLNSFQVDQDMLYFYDDANIFAFNMKTAQQSAIPLPSGNFKQIRIEKGELYALENGVIKKYRLEQ